MNNLFYRGSKESWNGQNQAEFSDSLVFITDENSREFYTGGKDYQCLTTPEKESVTALIEASAEFITKTEHEKTEQVISASLNDLNSRLIDLDDAVNSMAGSIEVPTKVSQLENDANYITDADIAGKQDKIDDLETIRANASSALKEIPAEYVTEGELQAKGYLTEHQDISGKADVTALNAHTSDASIHVTAADKTKWNTAEQSAKDYADELNGTMAARVEALEAWQFATEDDINKILNGTYVPSPEGPETPEDPEIPTENVGVVTEDNSIVVDETQLENGTYTLRYIDSEDNIIDNFNEIASFEINK